MYTLTSEETLVELDTAVEKINSKAKSKRVSVKIDKHWYTKIHCENNTLQITFCVSYILDNENETRTYRKILN